MPFLLNRRTMLATGSAAAWDCPAARAQPGTLRIAMTTADIPTIGGIPNNGAEGYRFAGDHYEGLTNWDLTSPTTSRVLSLAWRLPGRSTRTIRSGGFLFAGRCKFHDGTAFNADAVVWNSAT